MLATQRTAPTARGATSSSSTWGAAPRRCANTATSVRTRAASADPVVTLRFLQTEDGGGAEPVVVECPSGEQLRAVMIENKVCLVFCFVCVFVVAFPPAPLTLLYIARTTQHTQHTHTHIYKVDLYTTWGKIWSCSGAGQCGTCIVRVVQGSELMSARTETEEKKLKGKPAEWRLACQTIVGDGESGGSATVETKPQAAR